MKTTKEKMPIVLSFRCPEWLLQNLRKLAKEQMCSESTIIRQALKQHFESINLTSEI